MQRRRKLSAEEIEAIKQQHLDYLEFKRKQQLRKIAMERQLDFEANKFLFGK